MLAAGDVPESRRAHYSQALHADAVRLSEQVERILDFGRLQHGGNVRRDPVAGRTVLAHGLRQGRPALRLVGQRLAVEAPRSLPPIVGDLDVLARALRNLLENAAKYAPAGSTVSVKAFAEADDLVIEVADQGPGIPAMERRIVFDPFRRGSNAGAGVAGSGLGLALVAAAAEHHGGRIVVHDRPGGGAVFRLALPIARGAAS
jgi:two-component system, OmpR family, sensor histidine kinase KdpD